MVAFFNNSSISPAARDFQHKWSWWQYKQMSSLCVQAGTLKQMCTADLGSMSQGTGHRCTCSLLSIKGQSNFGEGCSSPQFVSEHELLQDICTYLWGLHTRIMLIFFALFYFFLFVSPNSHPRHTWLSAGCQSAFPVIWAGIQEETCAARPLPRETEGLQWCFTT